MENDFQKMTKEERGFGLETFLFLIITIGIFVYIGSIMGVGEMFNTILNTAFRIFIDTVLYIGAICTLMGALSSLLVEFGVVNLAQWLLTPIMKPIYNMPGVSSLGILATFFSDNPAILSLVDDATVRSYFKKYQLASLTNLGTTFGMGMIIIVFMLGLGSEFGVSVVAGLAGCISASIVSTRLMQYLSKRHYLKEGTWEEMQQMEPKPEIEEKHGVKRVEKRSLFSRVMESILEGGKNGWKVIFDITPGVICICTAVMVLTFGPGEGGQYTGAAYEGIELLPKLGDFLHPITDVLFGFQHGSNITVPITSLGAVGAAIGLIPKMVEQGFVGPNEVAVFTAMGMSWSGYLSTHISMMDALGRRELIPAALTSHTIAGLVAGTVAHYVYLLIA